MADRSEMTAETATPGPERVKGLSVLLTAKEVGRVLKVPSRRVYKLGIPVVRVGERTLRWAPEDVRQYITSRRLAA